MNYAGINQYKPSFINYLLSAYPNILQDFAKPFETAGFVVGGFVLGREAKVYALCCADIFAASAGESAAFFEFDWLIFHGVNHNAKKALTIFPVSGKWSGLRLLTLRLAARVGEFS